MGILIAVLTNNASEKTATAKDFSEIEYVIQLGVQFVSVNKISEAWLLLEQAVYMSLNSKMTGLLYAVFEVLLPLSFLSNYSFSPTLPQLISIVKKKDKTLPFDDYKRRSKRVENVDEKILMKRVVEADKMPIHLTGFLDVISAEFVDFKKIGRCMFVQVVDWQTMNFIGIVDPTLSLDEHLTVGSSLKVLSGKVRVIKPSPTMQKNRGVDLLIVGKPDNLRFVVRRAGQVELAQSRVGEYDL
jgi:hypothetical protein